MKKSEIFPELLKSASESVRRAARRKKKTIAISEGGTIKFIYPDKKIKVVKTSHHKEKK
jgi:hypothetical protein